MMNVRGGNATAKSERTEYVSGNYFSTFGLGAYAGRMLQPSDDVPGAAPVAVLSYAAWQADHAGDPKVIDSTFYIQSQPSHDRRHRASGFLRRSHRRQPSRLWIPLNVEPVIEGETSILKQPDTNWLYVLGRIKPGVTPGSLQAKALQHAAPVAGYPAGLHRNGGDTQIP